LLRSFRARVPAAFDAAWAAAGQDQAPWLRLDRPTLELVKSWLSLSTWSASLEFARDHLDALLDPSAAIALDEMAFLADPVAIGARRAVLEAAAEHGVDAAYEPLILAEQADLLASRGQRSEAEAQYRKAVALAPNDLVLRMKFGNLLGSQGRHDESEKQYRKAVELAPLNPIASRGWGIELMLMGRLDDAEAPLRWAIELEPGDAFSHTVLGDLLTRLARHEEARAEYNRVVEMSPTDPEAHRDFGAALQRGVMVDPQFYSPRDRKINRALLTELLYSPANFHSTCEKFLSDFHPSLFSELDWHELRPDTEVNAATILATIDDYLFTVSLLENISTRKNFQPGKMCPFWAARSWCNSRTVTNDFWSAGDRSGRVRNELT
jgi:Flp pilus assembly protein TadD